MLEFKSKVQKELLLRLPRLQADISGKVNDVVPDHSLNLSYLGTLEWQTVWETPTAAGKGSVPCKATNEAIKEVENGLQQWQQPIAKGHTLQKRC